MPGALEGVKIVELAIWAAGPAGGGIMADWGAEVIKIEDPEGEILSAGFCRLASGPRQPRRSMAPSTVIIETRKVSRLTFVPKRGRRLRTA